MTPTPACFARGARRVLRGAIGLALLALTAGWTERAVAGSPFLVVPDPAVAEQSAAYRYANMTDAEATGELDRRGVPYAPLGDVQGVRAPIRLTGRLHGVWFHGPLAPARADSPFEILDARLALALDDLAAILERHDIDEVLYFSMYRPAGAVLEAHGRGAHAGTRNDARRVSAKQRSRASASKSGPVAQRRRSGRPHRGTAGAPGTRHPAGLAIDAAAFHKRGGPWLSVAQQFRGSVGDKTCGDGVKSAASKEARELRSIVCEAADLGVFTYVLTPNYDAAHADHLHMEIKHGVRWSLYH